jgi:signal transduction histidine kinase
MTRQIDDELIADVNEYAQMLSAKGLAAIKNEVVREAESDGIEKVFFRIFTRDGKLVRRSNIIKWNNLGDHNRALEAIRDGRDYYFESLREEDREHTARAIYGEINPDLVLQIGMTLEEKDTFLELVQIIFCITLIIIIGLAALLGFFLTQRSLSGVKEVTQAAFKISKSGNLNQRVSQKDRGEEIEKLSATFNSMLDRIHALVAGIKDMADNIAHDLKSPISRIRTIAELTLTNGRTMDEFKHMAGDTIEECDRLIDMINSMLDLSEAEAGAAAKIELQPVNLAQIVQDACELFEPIAEDESITLECTADKPCMVNGNIQKLQRMVANILDNAIKYTLSGGKVSVILAEDNQNASITFKDNGIGIDAEELPNIFKRFYRCEKSRTSSGIGLGLSLARMIARNHDGDINVSSEPMRGTEFVINIPKLQAFS